MSQLDNVKYDKNSDQIRITAPLNAKPQEFISHLRSQGAPVERWMGQQGGMAGGSNAGGRTEGRNEEGATRSGSTD